MGDLTSNFSRHEFRCQCEEYGKRPIDGYCGSRFEVVDVELVSVLEVIRQALCNFMGNDVKLRITSGCRCPKHNADRGGSDNSYHVLGTAVDFQAWHDNKLLSHSQVYDIINKLFPDEYGMKQYHNRIHFDVRKTHWREALL